MIKSGYFWNKTQTIIAHNTLLSTKFSNPKYIKWPVWQYRSILIHSHLFYLRVALSESEFWSVFNQTTVEKHLSALARMCAWLRQISGQSSIRQPMRNTWQLLPAFISQYRIRLWPVNTYGASSSYRAPSLVSNFSSRWRDNVEVFFPLNVCNRQEHFAARSSHIQIMIILSYFEIKQ